MKADGTHVTHADLAAQERIAAGLQREFPGVPVIGEEGGLDQDPCAGARWYIDPIDGTSAYTEGLAHWGPTVGLVDGDQCVLSAFFMPVVSEFYFAKKGVGAYFNGSRLRLATTPSVTSRDVVYVPSRFHRAPPVAWRGKARSLGSTAAHMAIVARGGARAAIMGHWAPWDVVNGLLLIEEAGGVITDLSGRDMTPLRVYASGPKRTSPSFIVGDRHSVRHLATVLRNTRYPRTSARRPQH